MPPSWQGKSKGTPLGYRIFIAVLKKGGLTPAYTLLRFVCLYFFFFSLKSSRPVYAFFRQKIRYSRLKSLISLYRNYNLFGQSLIDRISLMSDANSPLTFNFDGEEHLHAIAALQKGGLLLSAHIGNWEIAGHLFKRLATPIHIVMFDAEHQQIKAVLDKAAGKKSIHAIVIKEDLSHIYEISEAFKNNELVCMHADRFLEGNKTMEAAFLGRQARFPMGPFVLAATFKVPVSFVFAVKENSLHYHLFASKIKQYDQLKKEAMMQQMLTDFAAAMEEKVTKYPEQWFNYYNFWS